MKWNKTLTIITIGYLILNILFLVNVENLNSGNAMVYLLIFPLFWLSTIILLIFLSQKNKKKWFSNKMIISTIFLLILCTPISTWIISELLSPKIELSSSAYNPKNGKTYKSETWVYKSGKIAIKKYWKLDTENWMNANEKEYKKDSIWIYFNKDSDTTKIEKYKNGLLVKKKEFINKEKN